MSSSYRLSKRLQEPSYYGFGDWNDHYIKSGQGECSPNYDTIRVGGRPGGVKICARKKRLDGSDTTHPIRTEEKARNIKYRHSSDLYNPEAPYPRQVSNAYTLQQRKYPPGTLYAIENDLIRAPVKYDATGVRERRGGTDPRGTSQLFGFDAVRKVPENYDSYYPHDRKSVYEKTKDSQFLTVRNGRDYSAF